ncbi:MAG: hypothetical protein ACOYI4_08965 [Christensenellales bacterium]
MAAEPFVLHRPYPKSLPIPSSGKKQRPSWALLSVQNKSDNRSFYTSAPTPASKLLASSSGLNAYTLDAYPRNAPAVAHRAKTKYSPNKTKPNYFIFLDVHCLLKANRRFTDDGFFTVLS